MASYRDYLPAVSSGDWVRPSDWLPMPTVTDVEEKFVGLHGVWEDGDNVVAFVFRGAYTVDWGDGVVENIADNVKAEHQYTWGDIPVGTTTSQGYRQVMITVTPQAGQNLTSCNFQQRYTGRNVPYSTGFLDVTLSMPNATAGLSIVFGGTTVAHANVERATVLTIGGATDMTSMFQNCRSIQSIPLFNTAAVAAFISFCNACLALSSIPAFDFSNGLDMSFCFANCVSLVNVPELNLSSAINIQSFFSGCRSLINAPMLQLNTVGAAVTMASLFLNCESLASVPMYDTQKGGNMSSFFQGCLSIKSIPNLNTANATNLSNFINTCRSLQSIGALDTTNATSFGEFAVNANSLTRCEVVFRNSVRLDNANLSAPALVEIFTNLVDRSLTTSANINITSNWGAALLTAGERAIATDKNWTITG